MTRRAPNPCYNPPSMPRTVGRVAALAALLLAGACASAPTAPPPQPPPVTRLYDRSFPVVWDTVRVELNNEPRLEVDTIDKRGRFVAWERTSNFLLLLRHRNVATITLEQLGEDKTRLALQMSAQNYDAGGFTRPAGWYPSADIDAALGEEIAAHIDERLDHTPGLADQLAAPKATTPADELPPPPATEEVAPGDAPTPSSEALPSRDRTGWRRFWPPWPFRRNP